MYYVLSKDQSYPPDFTTYINSVQSQIGAETTWTESSQDIYSNFANTGDWIKSAIGDLEKVIDAGIRTVIFDGDVVSSLSSVTDFNSIFCRTIFATIWVSKGWSRACRPRFRQSMHLRIGPNGRFKVRPPLPPRLLSVHILLLLQGRTLDSTRTRVHSPTSGSMGKKPAVSCCPCLTLSTSAGHEVPAYTVGDLPRGTHALTMFTQAMALQPISST